MRTTHAFRPSSLECLERREVLSQFGRFRNLIARNFARRRHAAPIVAKPPVAAPPVANAVLAAENPSVVAMQNLGQTLTDIYTASQNGASAATLAASFPTVRFQGESVGVSLRARSNETTLAADLQNLGASIIATSDMYLTVQAFVPVSQLPAVAQLDQTLAGSAMFKPMLNNPSGPGGLFR